MIDLFPHQEQALDELRQKLRAGSRRIMLQMPTGAGKTRTAARIIEGYLSRGKRALFTVPSIELVKQAIRDFEALGIREIGVIQGGHERTDWNQPVQIASIQTLQRRKVPAADVILVDEAHVLFQFYQRLFNEPAHLDTPIVGLSASPWSRGLGKLYSDLLVPTTTQRLIDEGYLSPFKVFAPTSPDLKGVRTRAGDYAEEDLEKVMGEAKLVADIVSTWERLGEGRQTLCFGVNRVHAKKLEEQFRAAGVTTAYIDGYTKDEDREVIRKQFLAGDVQVVCNVGIMTTGIDLDVRCIILARPTKSKILYTQIVGRGLRTAEGKDHLLLLDHSDSTLRLGLVTDIQQDHLDDGKSRGPAEGRVEEALPKKCPSCSFLKPAKTPACPMCGFKSAPQNKITCDAGDLVEITAKLAKKRHLTVDERRTVYGMLAHYGKGKFHNRGWIKHRFIDFTGIWPDGVENAPLIPPSPAMMLWIKGQAAKYALGRRYMSHRPRSRPATWAGYDGR